MIEVEKKFILTDEQEKQLIEGAEFLGYKVVTDTYYDTRDYVLTTKDLWLRRRNGKFNLKVPMNAVREERISDQYRELDTDAEIASYLKLPTDKLAAKVLQENGYAPFVTITTTRKRYKKDGYNIDLDVMDFGYNIAEIEYMTDDDSQLEQVTNKIIAYARSYNIAGDAPWGKVLEYLRRNDPIHFQALVDAKVV